MKLIIQLIALGLFTSCAVAHHAQLGEIDNTHKNMRRFDVKLSETGVDLGEAARIIDHSSKTQKGSEANSWIQMFQFGPRTGSPVYNEHYAIRLIDLVYKECPSGKVTGLTSIRETRKYPVISGEIVKITGWCIR